MIDASKEKSRAEFQTLLTGIFGSDYNVWVWLRDDVWQKNYGHSHPDDLEPGSRKFAIGGVESPIFLSWEETRAYAETNKDKILAEAKKRHEEAAEAQRIHDEARTKKWAEEAARQEAKRLEHNQASIDRLSAATALAGNILKTEFGNVDQQAAVRLAEIILRTTYPQS